MKEEKLCERYEKLLHIAMRYKTKLSKNKRGTKKQKRIEDEWHRLKKQLDVSTHAMESTIAKCKAKENATKQNYEAGVRGKEDMERVVENWSTEISLRHGEMSDLVDRAGGTGMDGLLSRISSRLSTKSGKDINDLNAQKP